MTEHATDAIHSQPCCASLTRRELLIGASAAAIGGMALSAVSAATITRESERIRAVPGGVPLRVQPVLVYDVPVRQQATSWRNWGGIQTEQDAAAEKARISAELERATKMADFAVEFLPLATVRNGQVSEAVLGGRHDVTLIYAAGGGVEVHERLASPGKWAIMFVRHRSGPVYLWYEIAHPRFLRKTVDEYGQPGMTPQDVVVDSYPELLWRLRALGGLRNTLGKRIVAVGGASGWGAGGGPAPQRSRDLWKLEILDVSYPDLGERIRRARQDDALVKRCRADAEAYLKRGGVSLRTTRQFVDNAFLLTEVFKDLMQEAHTDAITINACMGTIMPMAETTACLPLSLLNDAGYLAFCESDFVVIPSGMLLHHISGKPVFLNDPTYPHDGEVTLAHCTAPRKMDGRNQEDVLLLTHFESDYGAAPKVQMRKGQRVTTIDPDFASERWLGFEGEISAIPFLDICRSQIDVRVDGDCDRLLEEMRGFHWMTCYGSYSRELGYALRKVGVNWTSVTPRPQA